MDWSWVADVLKIVVGAVVGIAVKVIYDRRFAKKPDLRFGFGAPAKFGTGDNKTVYQTLEVANAGTETTTDVRINFSLPMFDLVDHQVSYDGPVEFERAADRTALKIQSLPPGDAITLYFVFSPARLSIEKIQELFISAKSKDCVARPLERSKTVGSDSISVAMTAVALLTMGFFVFQPSRERRGEVSQPQGYLTREKIEELRKKQKEIAELVRLRVQSANLVSAGSQGEIQCYIENTSENPLDGTIEITPPKWVGVASFFERVNVRGKTQKSLVWKFVVPKDVAPGKYQVSGEVRGHTLDIPIRVETKEIIEVR